MRASYRIIGNSGRSYGWQNSVRNEEEISMFDELIRGCVHKEMKRLTEHRTRFSAVIKLHDQRNTVDTSRVMFSRLYLARKKRNAFFPFMKAPESKKRSCVVYVAHFLLGNTQHMHKTGRIQTLFRIYQPAQI